MTRLRRIYKNGECVTEYLNNQLIFTTEDDTTIAASYYVMGDIQPYLSTIDGTLIQSRSRHREHLRQHGCIEVGNDSSVLHPQYKPRESPPGLKDAIIRATNEVMERQRR